MTWPRQRGLLGQNDFDLPKIKGHEKAEIDYCPHCLNGGGVGKVKALSPKGLWTPFEPTDPSFRFRDDHDLNGDAKGVRNHALGGKYTAGVFIGTYEEEDYIDFEVAINAHHNGYLQYWICDLDGCGADDIEKKCFKEGHCRALTRVPHPSCESGNDKACGPIDPKYPGRWVLPCKKFNTFYMMYGGKNKKMRYALPKGFTSKKAVISWAWVTANTCNPPGFADYKFPKAWGKCPGDGGSIGGRNPTMGECGSSQVAFPEEFWSTSEFIKVLRKGTATEPKIQIFQDGEMNVESGPQPKYQIIEGKGVPAPDVDDEEEDTEETDAETNIEEDSTEDAPVSEDEEEVDQESVMDDEADSEDVVDSTPEAEGDAVLQTPEAADTSDVTDTSDATEPRSPIVEDDLDDEAQPAPSSDDSDLPRVELPSDDEDSDFPVASDTASEGIASASPAEEEGESSRSETESVESDSDTDADVDADTDTDANTDIDADADTATDAEEPIPERTPPVPRAPSVSTDDSDDDRTQEDSTDTISTGSMEEAEEADDRPMTMTPSENGSLVESSKYKLERYVQTYDTGKCMKDSTRGKVCQACMDLGHGVTKCWWCEDTSDGRMAKCSIFSPQE